MVNNLAILFAGQGAQKVSMCKDLYEKYNSCKKLIDRSCDILGYDIKSIMFEGPQETLDKTIHAQPALYISGFVCYEVFKETIETEVKAVFTAGLSLGEYTAAAYASSFEFERGLSLVDKRAKFMQQACDHTKGAMASILGLSQANAEEIVNNLQNSGVIVISNYNSTDQFVISGEMAQIEKAIIAAKDKGAKRVIPLRVAGAYHSPLMNYASEKMKDILKNEKIDNPTVPIISNATAKPLASSDEVRNSLVEQLTKPVLWKQTLDFLHNKGITSVLEFGPGKVATGILKRLYPNINCTGISNVDDIKSLTNTSIT